MNNREKKENPYMYYQTQLRTKIVFDLFTRLRLRSTFLLAALAFACFGLLPTSQALLPPPPPDGGYPGDNTAEGDSALFNLTTGIGNTAVGASALFVNTTGSNNTAIGDQSLFFN